MTSGPAPPASEVRVASQLFAWRVALTVTPLPRALNGSTAFSTRHSAPSAPPVVSSHRATSAESWASTRDAGTTASGAIRTIVSISNAFIDLRIDHSPPKRTPGLEEPRDAGHLAVAWHCPEQGSRFAGIHLLPRVAHASCMPVSQRNRMAMIFSGLRVLYLARRTRKKALPYLPL